MSRFPNNQPTNDSAEQLQDTWSWVVPVALILFVLLTGCGSASTATVTQGADESARETGPTVAAEATEVPATPVPATEIPATQIPATVVPTPEPTAIPTAIPTPTETPAPEPRYVLEGELDFGVEEINGFLSFIEEETGRDFLYPPRIVAQDLVTFEEGLAPSEDDLQEAAHDIEIMGRYLQALGLTDLGHQDLSATYIAGMSSSDVLGGYYDPDTDAIYIPDTARDGSDAQQELFQAVLVHELVHALDGQHVDLGRVIEGMEALVEAEEFETVTALRAVVEGRATSVQWRWMADNAPAIMAGGLADMDMGLAAEMPPAIMLDMDLAYSFGSQMIEANGGPAETWDLYDNPPASSELVLFPGTSADEAIIDVPMPLADGPVLVDAEFGASDLLVWLLGESIAPTPDLLYPALGAAEGWAGGSMVMWGDESETCVRVAMVADSAPDLSEIEAAISRWAGDHADRTIVTMGDTIEVTGCSPYLP